MHQYEFKLPADGSKLKKTEASSNCLLLNLKNSGRLSFLPTILQLIFLCQRQKNITPCVTLLKTSTPFFLNIILFSSFYFLSYPLFLMPSRAWSDNSFQWVILIVIIVIIFARNKTLFFYFVPLFVLLSHPIDSGRT